MNLITIKKIKPLKASIIFSSIIFIGAITFGFIIAIFSQLLIAPLGANTPEIAKMSASIWFYFILIIPLISIVTAFILGFLLTGIYNLASRVFGGMEIETTQN